MTIQWAHNPIRVPEMDNVATVSAGIIHTMAIDTNGQLWGWGDNRFGQLGVVTTTTRHFDPVRVPGMDNVIAVSAGGRLWWGEDGGYTMAIDTDGQLWGWGSNFSGQLGDGTTTSRYSPMRVPGMDNIVAVSTGKWHTMAIDADGQLWGWGRNDLGQLGDGTTTSRYSPIKVPGMSNVIAVSANLRHTMAIDADGQLWGWGLNGHGQLGDGTWTDRHNPIRVPGMDNVVAVSAGHYHTMAIDYTGQLWGWGSASSGRLGLGGGTYDLRPPQLNPARVPGMDNVVAVSAGWAHTRAVDSAGQLWGWGDWGVNVDPKAYCTPTRIFFPGTPPRITTESIPWAIAGQPFTYTLQATGTQPITWTLVSDAMSPGLPSGLSFDENTGTISGVPVKACTYHREYAILVIAYNAFGSDERWLLVEVWPDYTEAHPTISLPQLPNADINAGRGDRVEIPLTFVNNQGLSNFDIIIRYQPDIMTPVSFRFGNVVDGFFTMYNLNFAPDGIMMLGFGFGVPPSDGTIAYITFDINEVAPGGVHPIKIELLTFNKPGPDGFTPAPINPVVNNGHIDIEFVMLGDANSDGLINSVDASRVFGHIVGSLGADPLNANQRVAADVNQDGVIDMADVNMIMAIAGGLIPPPGMFSAGIPDLARVEIPAPMMFMPFGANIVSVPVGVQSGVGLSGFDITLSYDNQRLSPIGFTLGGAWQDLIIFNPDAGYNYVKLVGASAFNVSLDGNIAYVIFEVIGDDIASIADHTTLNVSGLARVVGADVIGLSGYAVDGLKIVVE